MSHARQTVRDQAVAVLTGLATTGTNVFASRVHPLYENVLPCLLISTDGEDIEIVSGGNGAGNDIQLRTITLNISAVAKAVDTLDDTLDDISTEVEVAMAAYTTGAFKRKQLKAVKIRLSGDGDQPIGTATMIYEVQVFTKVSTPDVII